jgi:hypothetical protein
MAGHEHWQLDASTPELYERYLVPAITSIWAVDLLDRYTPTKFTQQQKEELKLGGLGLGQGAINLLNYLSSLRGFLRALSSSPDGKKLVILTLTEARHGGLFAEVYDERTGKMISQFGAYPWSEQPILVWSQDSSKLLVGWGAGSNYNFAAVHDVADGKLLGGHGTGNVYEIQSFEISEDGQRIVVKMVDGRAEAWPLSSS